MRVSPVLAGIGTYPFAALTARRDAVAARGVDVIDFGVGEPRERTPAFIRAALAQAVEAEPFSSYPTAPGLPELREAIAAWVLWRFGARVDAGSEVIPTYGSKEAIFHLAEVVCAPGDVVAIPTPGYPVPDRGARFAGCEVRDVPLDPARGWLPDLEAVDWDGVRLLWLNFPGNPTAARATPALYEHAAALAREHDFVLASDEAYSELWFAGEPPIGALSLTDRTNVLVLHTLSKRSSMPGYRCGFAAGDPELIAALRSYRPNVGLAPQTFVQHAATAAWSDEAHVAAARERYRAKHAVLAPALTAIGLEPAGGDASFFIWLRVPGDGDDAAFALDLLEHRGIVVAPGSFFGPGGEHHVRVALVPALADCELAAQRLAG